MPYNPAGLFSLVASYFANPGATIRTEQHNPPLEDIASALSSVYVRDGRAPMTGPLNMNGFAINNVAIGSSPSSVATLAQAMPIGSVIDYAGSTAPAGWALCYGQAISRSAYAALYALIGTTYGAGDGSTTFNLPDLRGRVSAGPDNMGGAASGRLTSAFFGAATAPGLSGGAQAVSILKDNLPAYSPVYRGSSQSLNVTSTSSTVPQSNTVLQSLAGGGSGVFALSGPGNGSLASTGSFTSAGTIDPLGSGALLGVAQPTLVLNKIIRVSYDV